MAKLDQPVKGRGAGCQPANRFLSTSAEPFDDGWGTIDEGADKPLTELFTEDCKTIMSFNQSPDIPFDRSINPYKGCEHGCVYCFARPTHAYLDCSPGLDFETKIFHKPNAIELLKKELSKKNYQCQPVSLGINTDAYQPTERHLKLTRQLLEVLYEFKHPVSIVTKSALVERDIDILSAMAKEQLVHVIISVTTLNAGLSRKMEPRAAAPHRRVQVIQNLTVEGIPTGVLIAPVIPVLNDHEIEAIIAEVHAAGALTVGYIMIRLPHEIKEIFKQWLQDHVPLKADHIMSRIRDLRGGKEYDATFGQRMKGTGVFAELIRKRFSVATRKNDFPGMPDFDSSKFTVPLSVNPQISLF